MANYILGQDAKAYIYDTALTAGANSDYATAITAGDLINNVVDLTCTLTKEKTDITTRGSGGWKNEVGTQKTASITFKMLWNPSDDQFTVIQTAYLDDSEVFFAALDQLESVVGSQGPAGNWTVTSFTREENLKDALMVSVELTPSSFTGWYTKAGS